MIAAFSLPRTFLVGRLLGLFASILLPLFGGTAVQGQTIRIRVLNGRNGHPLSDCINIWTGPAQVSPVLFIKSAKDGVALVHVGQGSATGIVSLRCKYVPTTGIIGPSESIALLPDLDIDCRPRNESGSLPGRQKFYSVDEILERGVATANTCGKYKTEPKPGELIFYVRPPHWWEAFSR